MRTMFSPTPEQQRVIEHDRSAFVSACPGAGKTRVLVERARRLLAHGESGKGIAFLSFTNAAVSELEQRLRVESLLRTPSFPSFIGTFDGFVWQFLVAPFGVPGCETLRLVPDKNDRMIRPFEGARELPLTCFDRVTGDVIVAEAQRIGFDPKSDPRMTKAYVSAAAKARARFLARGELDFDDAREIAKGRLTEPHLSSRLTAALAGRFTEVIVDEAQDCNPADLEIIGWLRRGGIAIKVICDPHQSIYGFRGGVTKELSAFSKSFEADDQLTMSGNFRSSAPICNAIVALRPREARGLPDRALGPHAKVESPIHVLAYAGTSVPREVGTKFLALLQSSGFDPGLCPVLASTRLAGARAVGLPILEETKDLTLRLATAVVAFHFAVGPGDRLRAIVEVHKVVLAVEGKMGDDTYHQHLAATGVEPGAWRPRILQLVRGLRYEESRFPSAESWLERARVLLSPHVPPGGPSIAMKLRRNRDLADALAGPPAIGMPVRTIHAVKGAEFPAVCVVMTARRAKAIIDFLTNGTSHEEAEEARKIYVAASRAQRLLVFAVPKSQAARLVSHLGTTGTAATEIDV